jgi:thiamine kinase-like enzyme
LFNETISAKVNGLQIAAKLKSSFLEVGKLERMEKYHDILSYSLEWIKDKMVDVDINLAISHGDFIPWNVFKGKTEIFVFDWETADYRLPLWDLFNFFFHSQVLIYHKQANAIAEEVFNEKGDINRLIHKYLAMIQDKSKIDLNIFFAVYLFEIALYYYNYIKEQERFGFTSGGEAVDPLRIATELLEIVAVKRSN